MVSEPQPLQQALGNVISTLPANPIPARSDFARAADADEENQRRIANWRGIRDMIGPRYSRCDFDSFECRLPEQQAAKSAVTGFMANWPDNRAAGRGLLLYGPVGTGKDHLVIAALKVAVRDYGATPAWIDGQSFFATIRDRITAEVSEGAAIKPYTAADVLVISDPLPDAGKPTEFQRSLLWRIVDRRYRDLRPTFVTLNVANSREAEDRMGVQLVDRLRDGAVCVACRWASNRRPGLVVNPSEGTAKK